MNVFIVFWKLNHWTLPRNFSLEFQYNCYQVDIEGAGLLIDNCCVTQLQLHEQNKEVKQ